MCLLALAHRVRSDRPLIVAANRDEHYARPSAPLGPWPEAPSLVAGRDLEGGGTWLGITRGLRFAALTNVRDPASTVAGAPSRGLLVSGFLLGELDPRSYLSDVAGRASSYNPFNLLVGDLAAGELWYLGSRAGPARRLEPGVYGLSNAHLDTPWPKVVTAREALRALASRPEPPSHEDLLRPLLDRSQPPDESLPDTGVGLPVERALAPAFIVTERYGTRGATTLMVLADGSVSVRERTFRPGSPALDVALELDREAERYP